MHEHVCPSDAKCDGFRHRRGFLKKKAYSDIPLFLRALTRNLSVSHPSLFSSTQFKM